MSHVTLPKGFNLDLVQFLDPAICRKHRGQKQAELQCEDEVSKTQTLRNCRLNDPGSLKDKL